MCSEDSSTRCASAASASGRTRSTTGRTSPASTAGQTPARTAWTMAAFCSRGRERSDGRVDRAALAQQRVEVELGRRAALQPDDDQPAAVGERGDVAREVLRADPVEHHVGAAELLDRRDEVLVAVEHDPLGPERAYGVGLGRRADGGDHPRPGVDGQLDGHRPDPGRAAVDQEHLARLQTGDHEDVVPDGAGDLRQGGGLQQRQPRRARAAAGRSARRPARRSRHRTAARRPRRRPPSRRRPPRARPRCPSTRDPGTAARRAAAGSGPSAASRRPG